MIFLDNSLNTANLAHFPEQKILGARREKPYVLVIPALPLPLIVGTLSDLSCHRTPHGGFCLDSEQSPHLCAETIYAGESCALPGDRTRSCTRNGRGTARHITRANNIMSDSTFAVFLSHPPG